MKLETRRGAVKRLGGAVAGSLAAGYAIAQQPNQTSEGRSQPRIKVGQIGEILENDDLVFTATLTDQDQKRLGPNDVEELLWRGTTMSRYGNGSWRRIDKTEEQIVTPTSAVPPKTVPFLPFCTCCQASL